MGSPGSTTVWFGSSKGKTISVNAAGTQLTVKSPAGTSGTSVNVQVVTPAGESPAVTADLFTYGPTITSLSRTSRSGDRWHQSDHHRDRVLHSAERQVRDNGSQDIHGQIVHPDRGHLPCARSWPSQDLGNDGCRDDAGHQR